MKKCFNQVATALCVAFVLWGCESAPQPTPSLSSSNTVDAGIAAQDTQDTGNPGTDVNQPDNGPAATSPCGNCDDGNVCTTDICAADGKCVHINVAVACNDGNACTVNDFCNNVGLCVGATAVCDDGNACTTDTCNPASGCVFTGKACDDGDPCTDDTCDKAKGCVSTPKTCDDGESCTKDICGAGGVCAHVATVGTCDDNNACTVNDACTAAGTCAGTLKSCDDQNPCTDDFCLAGACVHGINSAACDDNNACTEKDSCKAGTCAGTPKTCDDGDLCTIDACDKVKGCTTSAVQCNDNINCTLDTCDSKTGICQFTEVICNDNKAWTNDYCDEYGLYGAAGACVFEDKWNACQKDSDCTDKDPCTVDVCNSFTGTCSWVKQSCNDNNACTVNDTCVNGACVGSVKSCNDNNPATADSCDAITGACVFTPIAPSLCATALDCNDNNVNTNDACVNGACTHTPVGTPAPAFVCPGGFGFTAAGAGCTSATFWGQAPATVMGTFTMQQLSAGYYTAGNGVCSVTFEGCVDKTKVLGAGLYNSPWSKVGCMLKGGGFGFAFDAVCAP